MNYLADQCFFCSETDSLIHMDTNSLIIESVYIDFSQLISDLMQIKVCLRFDDFQKSLHSSNFRSPMTPTAISSASLARTNSLNSSS